MRRDKFKNLFYEVFSMVELYSHNLIAVALSSFDAGTKIDGLEEHLEGAFSCEEHPIIDEYFPLDDNDQDWRSFKYGIYMMKSGGFIVPYHNEDDEEAGCEITGRVHDMANQIRHNELLSPEDYDFFEGLGKEISA